MSGSEFRKREESAEAMDTEESVAGDESVFEKDSAEGKEAEQEKQEEKGEEEGEKETQEMSDSDSSEEHLSKETAELPGKKIIALFHKLRMESGLCS